MKSTKHILFLSGFFLSPFHVKAEIPKLPEAKDYANLLKRSPFGIKPVKKVEKVTLPDEKSEPDPEPKPSKDYELRGVTKLQDKWMVVVVDKKNPTKNIIIKQGSNSGARPELIGVTQDIDNYELTTATLKLEGQLVTVNYNKESLKANTTAKASNPKSSAKGGEKGPKSGDGRSSRDKERRERYERYMKYRNSRE